MPRGISCAISASRSSTRCATASRGALKLPFRNGTALDLAREALKISAAGLKRRARLNAHGADESIFLEPLVEIVESGVTAAERKLELFEGAWGGSVDPVFREFAY